MTDRTPRVWVLLGPRTGDNNQALALAEGLGLPFETRTLSYNLFRALSPRLLGRSRLSLSRQSRQWLAPPWPDLIIAVGRRSVPIGRWIRARSDSRAKLVRIGNPRMPTSLFDLVITTRQYPVPPGENVLLLSLAMGRHQHPPKPSDAERELLDRLPRPHLLMAIGGATKYWRMPPAQIADAAEQLAQRAELRGGTMIVVGSRRTDPEVMRAVTARVEELACARVLDDEVSFPLLLADADEIFVTSDSISMLSEAVLSGKPLGLIPIAMTERGRRKLGEVGGSRRRDLRAFWAHLFEEGLAGDLEHPASGPFEDPVAIAAARVRELLGDRVE